MDIRVEVGQPHERTIQVKIPWGEIEPVYTKKVEDTRKRVKMPGFRPGKVPQKIFLQQYGGTLLMDVMEDMIQRGYQQAIVEHELDPISQGQVENVENFDVGQDLKYTLKLEVEPEPKLFKYADGFKITRNAYEPTDRDVDHALEHLQEQHAETAPKEDGAAEGDLIKGDLQYLDENDVPLFGQKVENRYVRVGDGVFGGKVGEILTGAKTGDDLKFSIPTQDEKGTEQRILLTVKGVESYTLPEINEDFAKLVNPNIESLDKLKEEIRADIQRQLDRDAKRAFQQELIQLVLDKSDVLVPESMIENYLERYVESVKKDPQNADADIDEDAVREEARPRAERELKWYLVKKKIVQDQKLEVTKEDVEARLDELTQPYGDQAEQMKALYRKKEYLRDIREEILENKVFDELLKNAKVKEKTVSTEKLGGKHAH
ncbi:MAG: trigger factor [Candidatus Marinimicrobia bacterium]|nr:trigger factor [Candidatus Neomarinimicrobiota bacterium]MCF7902592.1 trigger factor [Candidatus Neomarinimicrobiota bacterium]